MASNSTIEVLQGELERLFELPEMLRLSEEILGFAPAQVGGTASKGAFARSLVSHCAAQDALAALVDAILLSSDAASSELRDVLKNASNGELRPGTRVSGMRVVKKIGEGGLSVVYLVESEAQPSERAALKVIRPQFSQDRAAVHRFTTASRIMRTLQSPGLAPILDVGHLEDARPWVAAAYLTGQTLAQRIKRTGSLHINEALPILTGVLQGLIALHDRGLLHGDIKVENVFVMRGSRDDGVGEPFGVLVDGGSDRLLSRATLGVAGLLPALGTAKSLAPEQARGAEPDQRSDVYQTGTMIYETLAGRPPFQGASAIDVVAQHLSALPEPPSTHARKGWVSTAIDEIVMRALAKDPAERFQNASELLDALSRAAKRPAVERPLNEAAFQEARRLLFSEPGSEERAERVEELARQSNVFARAAGVFEEVAQDQEDAETKLTLLFRAARIYDTELKQTQQGEALYEQILQIDPSNEVALRGIESAKRAAGDHEGLIGLLLDRVDREGAGDARQLLLREVASIYEKQLRDTDNALLAWTQALISDAHDDEAIKSIERLAGSMQTRWNEVVEMLSQSAQQAHEALLADPQTALEAAEQELESAQTTIMHVEGMLAQKLQAQKSVGLSQQAGLEHAEQAHADAQRAVEAAEMSLEIANAQVAELVQSLETEQNTASQGRADAETRVEAYEALQQESGESPTPEQQAELERIGAEAEALVATAEAAEGSAEEIATNLQAAQALLEEEQAALDTATARANEAEAALQHAREQAPEGDADTDLSDAEQEELAAARQRLVAAQTQLRNLGGGDARELAARRERDLANLVQSYVVLGHWYEARLSRPDIGLTCFSHALQLDGGNDAAFDGIVDLYRGSQSWPELSAALLSRAEHAQSPLKARDYRTDAAIVIANKLNDQAQARQQLEYVLADDPDHPRALRVLVELLREQGDWQALAEKLEHQASALRGEERAAALLALAEVYEDHLGDLDRAAIKYLAASEADPRELGAYKGLERVYARTENYEGLVHSLRAQVDLVATPKQRITLLERIGLLLEEDFVDHAEAAACFEKVIATDGSHEGANTALARLYRNLQRFEDLVETLDRHASTVDDPSRKVELMLQAARTLAVEIGSPERAIELYEEVLGIDEVQAEALSELARLKTSAGDVAAAVHAVERMAEQEEDPRKQATLRVRAGKLLEDSGDREGATTRYKIALDLDRQATGAADALRNIYSLRGDARGAAEMLVYQIGLAEGSLQRAALLAELGTIYRDELGEPEQTKVAFEEAVQLDPTNTVAVAGLARIAIAEGDNAQGVELLRDVLPRLSELPPREAGQLCTEAANAYQALGNVQEAGSVLKLASELLPDSLDNSERYAAFLLKSGDAAGAEQRYEQILKQHADGLEIGDRVRLTLALGEAQLGVKRGKRAHETFRRVLEWVPDHAQALDGVTRVHEQAGAWNEVISMLQLRAKRAENDDEMFELMVKTGDVFLERLHDRDAASQTYVMALDVKPESRNLLSKLMAVYSDAKDWPRLIEIILRIAEMVKDPAQLAKYYNTAATIAHAELGRFDEAANYYEAALSHSPGDGGDAQFIGLVQCLTENQDWERLSQAYEARITRLRQVGAEPKRIAPLLEACADMMQNRMGRLPDALRLYEEALAIDPDNDARRSMLTSIYTKEPKRFFQSAVAAHRYYLAADPYRVESLQALRTIYTSGKRPDESWCVCQALRCLKMADVDEEKFFKKYRLAKLPKMKQPITDELWRDLIMHPAQDPALTAIFATLQQAAVLSQTQQLSSLGISERLRVDPQNDPNAMARMLAYITEQTASHTPPVYYSPNDPGGLSFLFSAPPAVGIGEGGKAGGPQQALAFVAGRHLSYFRQGHFMRQLVPTGTGLRAWLLGAIRSVSPRFPAPANMEAQVRECAEAITAQLVGPQREALRSMTQKLLEAAPELDMKAWMAGLDLTADRIGFVVSNDLKIANAVIEASPEDSSSVSRKDRLRELLAYSVSEQYFQLRQRTGIALGG